MNGEWSLFGEASCVACSAVVVTPPVEQALLDEDGCAHVLCACGAENRVPLVVRWPGPQPAHPPVDFMTPFVVWLIVAAMLLLLLPAIGPTIQPEEPTPTIRLV
jgi:hypothetical protein